MRTCLNFLKNTSRAALLVLQVGFAISCVDSPHNNAPPSPKEFKVSLSRSVISVGSFSGTGPFQIEAGSKIDVKLTFYDEDGNSGNPSSPVSFYLTGGGSAGSFSPVKDAGKGKKASEFTGTIAGSPSVIHAKVGNDEITSPLPRIQVDAGLPSLTNSTTTLAAANVLAGANVNLTVALKDPNGNSIPTAKGTPTFKLIDPAGRIPEVTGSFTDNGDGTFSAQVRGTLAGKRDVQVFLNGVAVSNKLSLQISPGNLSPAHSRVTIASNTVRSGERVQMTFRTFDAHGNALTAGGKQIYVSTIPTTAHPSTVNIGAVNDQNNGLYSVDLEGVRAGDPIQLKVETDAAGGGGRVAFGSNLPTIQVTPGAASAQNSEIHFSQNLVQAGMPQRIRVVIKDSNGNLTRLSPSQSIRMRIEAGKSQGTFGPTVYNPFDGSYQVEFIGTTAGAPAQFTAQFEENGRAENLVNHTQPVAVTPGKPSDQKSEISVSKSHFEAGTEVEVTLTVKDFYGNRVVDSNRDQVEFETFGGSSSGKFHDIQAKGQGVYTAKFLAEKAGSSTYIGARFQTSSYPIALVMRHSVPSVTIFPGPASDRSTLVLESKTVESDKTVAIRIEFKDRLGNVITDPIKAPKSIQWTVSGGTSTGEFVSSSVQPDGKWLANFRGIVAGSEIAISAKGDTFMLGPTLDTSLKVVPGPFSLAHSEISISANKVAVGSSVLAKLILRDRNKNQLIQDPWARPVVFNYSRGSEIGTGTFAKAQYQGQGIYTALFTGEKEGTLFGEVSASVEGNQVTSPPPRLLVELPIFFVHDRDLSKNLKDIPSRKKFNIEAEFSRPGNEVEYSNQLHACLQKYQEQWPKTERLVENLKNKSQCWDLEHWAEIQALRTVIKQEFDEVQSQRTQRPQLPIVNDLVRTNQEFRTDLFKLGRHYQEIQEHLSYCRIKDVVPLFNPAIPAAPSDLEFGSSEDKRLLHALGDTFGEKSGLEGQNYQEFLTLLSRRLDILESVQKTIEAKQYIANADQAEPCREILGGYHPSQNGHGAPMTDSNPNDIKSIVEHGWQAYRLTQAYHSSLEEFTKELKQEFSHLKGKGDWLFFRIGTFDHTMTFRVIQDYRDFLVVQIFTSGDGIEFNEGVLSGSTELAHPFFEKQQVKRNSLLKLSLLKALRDVKIQQDPERRNSKVAFIYDNISQELGGIQTTLKPRLADFQLPQLIGNCTYYVLPFMQTSVLGDQKRGSHLEFFVESRILDSYFSVNEARIKKYEPVQNLARKAVTFYSEKIARNISEISVQSPSIQDRYIDWGMARESSERIEKYHFILNRAILEQKEKAKTLASTLSQAVSFIRTSKHSAKPIKLTQIEEVYEEKPDLSALHLADWVVDPNKLNKDLEGFLAKTKPVTQDGTRARWVEIHKIIEAVPDIVLKLPLEKSFYENLTQNQLHGLLSNLSELSQQQLWALVNLHKDFKSSRRGLSPLTVLAQIKILTLTDILAQMNGRFDRNYRQFPSLFHGFLKFLMIPKAQRQASIWLDKQWATLWMIPDQKWQEDFDKLSRYWTERVQVKSNYDPLFEWEKVPLYSDKYGLTTRFIQKFKPEKHFTIGWSDPWQGPPNSSHPIWNDVSWSLNTQSPGAKDADSIKQAIQALDYKSLKKWSNEFFEIRDISFITHYILNGSFDADILKEFSSIKSFGGSYWFSQTHLDRVSKIVNSTFSQDTDPITLMPLEYFTLKFVFFDLDNPYVPRAILKEKFNLGLLVPLGGSEWSAGGADFDQRYYQGNSNLSLAVGADQEHLHPWDEILNSKNQYYSLGASQVPISYARRLSSAEIVAVPQIRIPLKPSVKDPSQFGVTTLEMQRYLLNLGSPLVTLGFFQEHPDYLREKRWQILFKSIIFQPAALIAESKRTPQLKKLLLDFCISNFNRKFADEEYLNAAFFAKMIQLVEEILPRIDQNDNYKIAREMLVKILHKLKPPVSDEKNLIFRDLIRTYRFQNLSLIGDEELALFLNAVIYRDLNPFSDHNLFFDADEENAVAGIYLKRRSIIEDYFGHLDESRVNGILNQMMSFFDSRLGRFTWSRKVYPNRVWVGRRHGSDPVEVDLTFPRVYLGKQEQKTLPGVISQYSQFKDHVAWKAEVNPYVKWLGDQRFELVDQKDQRRVRIDASVKDKEESSFRIEKQWGNHWYRLIADTTVNKLAINETPDWSVTPGYENWKLVSTQSPFPSDPAYREAAGFSKEDLENWQRISPENGGEEILAFQKNPETGVRKLYSVSRILRDELIVQKVDDSKGFPEVNGTTLYHNLTMNPGAKSKFKINPDSLVELLSRIEMPRMICVWKKPGEDGSVQEIEFPRFDVSFKNIAGKWVSSELDGYSLSEEQFYPGLSFYPHYLVIEKKSDRRILVPKFRFKSREKGEKGLVVHYDLNWNARSQIDEKDKPEAIHQFGRKSQRLYIWSIDSFSNELRLPDYQDRYFLAMIHLWGHSAESSSYDLARDLLYGARSHLDDLRSDPSRLLLSGAREVLDWLIALGNQDHDPRSIALQLGAAFIALENDLANHRYRTIKIEIEGREENVVVPESLEDGPRRKYLSEKYQYYLKTREKISTRWIPEELEKLYLTQMESIWKDKMDPLWKNRLAELIGKNSKIEWKPAISVASINSTPSFHYSEIATIIQGVEKACTKKSDNVFLGNFMDVDLLYLTALSVHHAKNAAQLRPFLANILGVSDKALSGHSVDDLKEEFLSYLRLQIRQQPTERVENSSSLSRECIKFAEFLYSVANCRDAWQLPMSWERLKEVFRPEVNSQLGVEERTKIYKKFKDLGTKAIEDSEINLVDYSFLRSPEHKNELPQRTSSQPARYWDPRPSLEKALVGVNLAIDQSYEKYRLKVDPVIKKTDLEKIIFERSLTGLESLSVSRTKNGLLDIFSFIPLETKSEKDDPFIQTKLKGIQKTLEQDLVKTTYEWKLKDVSQIHFQLDEILKSLNSIANQSKDLAAQIETEIQEIIKQLPKESWAKTKENVFRISEVEFNPSVKDLLREYAKDPSLNESFFASNPAFGRQRTQILSKLLTSYLIVSTYHFRANDTKTDLNSVLESVKSLADGSQIPEDFAVEEIKKFYQTATALRSYTIENHPDYLVFEFMMRQLIRKDQVVNLERLTSDQPSVLEMIPGAGKTSVLLPLASHKNSVKGEKLSIVILPEALVPSMVKQLSSQLTEVFGQGVDRLNVSRKYKYDVGKLENLNLRLRRDLDEGRVVVTSNSSIQSLFLIFIESLYEYRKLNEQSDKLNRKKEIEILQEIFSLFRKYGYVLIDEVDSILDILASHRFSVGQREMLDSNIVNAAVGIFKILADDPEIQNLVKIPFASTHSDSTPPFSREIYKQLVQDRLIGRVCSDASAEYFFESKEDQKIFRELDKAKMKQYFYLESKAAADAYIKSLPNDGMRDVLSVLFTEIHQMLPLTLDKTYLVHFGLCSLSEEELRKLGPKEPPPCNNWVSVPYHSGSEVRTSRFGTDLESLNYTIQSHLEKRDVQSMFRTEFNFLQQEYRKNRSPIVRRIIEDYMGPIPEGRIFSMPEKEFEERSKLISRDPRLILNLAKKYAVPKIEVYPDQLFTNSHIYPVIFRKIQGMTGTSWNYESYPEFFKVRYESDALARTLTALWKTADTRKVRVIDLPAKPTITGVLNALNEVSGQGVPSVIDQGGFFRGHDNQKVAEEMILLSENSGKQHLPITQQIYYNAQHQLRLIKRATPTSFLIRPYVMLDTNRFETGAFWDLQHTTGSDLKVHPKMRSLLTLSKFSILRDLIQSAWRLREIEDSQTVVIVITRDDLKVMSRLLEDVYGSSAKIIESDDKTIPFESVLLYLATHEAIKIGEVNYRSVKASQKAVVVESIFDALVGSPVGERLFSNFEKVMQFFSKPRAKHPYQTYGVPIVESNTFDYLTKEINRVFDPIQEFFKNFQKLKTDFSRALEKKKASLRKYIMIASENHHDGDEEIEVEAENEEEQEQEQEEELQAETHLIDSQYQKAPVKWPIGGHFNGNLFEGASLKKRSGLSSADVSALAPVLSMNEILSQDLPEYSGVFDSRLFGSLNLFPVFQTDYLSHDGNFKPFGRYQGMMDYLLIVVNKGNGAVLSLTLLTRDEALGELGEWLRTSSIASGNYVLIYQFGNKVVRASDQLLDLKKDTDFNKIWAEIEANPEFQKLFVQAKFVSGRMNYTESELPQLKRWISEHANNQRLLFNLFKIILSYKETSQSEFEHSNLYWTLNAVPLEGRK